MAIDRAHLLGKVAARPVNGTAVLDRLGRGRDLRHRMTWPGGALELELQVLSRGEAAAAFAAAMTACVARGIDDKATSPRAIESRADEEVVQILARAILDPATHQQVFASADELSAIATDDELAALYAAYSDHRVAVDPMPDEMPDEDFRALEAAIKKKDVSLLSAIASSMPRPWLRTSVVRLGTSLISSSISTSDSSASLESPEA